MHAAGFLYRPVLHIVTNSLLFLTLTVVVLSSQTWIWTAHIVAAVMCGCSKFY